ncbi:MAG: urease accessory protein UreD [Cyanobacteriota bacterium]|nr:urease accessory protein UreD [Cyanobacteriota bacterium]
MVSNHGIARLQTLWQNGSTVISQQYSQAPLQWLGPLERRALCPVVYLRNPNGGLLAGDTHEIQVDLAAHTQLELRTQSATRLHPGRCRQTLRLNLQPHSQLVYLPHPLIPGAASHFQQMTTIQMDPSARLAYGEIWTAGRIGMGECWQFQRLHSQMAVRLPSGAPWLWEALDLGSVDDSQSKRDVATLATAPSVLGSYLCWGSLYLLGNWPSVAWPCSATQWSVTSPQPHYPGQVLRQVADRAERIWQDFQSHLQALTKGSRYPATGSSTIPPTD